MDGSSDSKTSADRVARNQALFRSVNEQIETRSEGLGVSFERIDFVCECADEHCMAQVALRLSEYEDVRRIPTHFIVMTGHVYSGVRTSGRDDRRRLRGSREVW
jgi:hypothetical protein